MAEVDTIHTPRQTGLIKGDVQPDTNEEWSYVQEHASDILPETDKTPESSRFETVAEGTPASPKIIKNDFVDDLREKRAGRRDFTDK